MCHSPSRLYLTLIDRCYSPSRLDLTLIDRCHSPSRLDLTLIDSCHSPSRLDLTLIDSCHSPSRLDLTLIDSCHSPSRLDLTLIDRCHSPSRLDLSLIDRCHSPSRFYLTLIDRCYSPSRLDLTLIDRCVVPRSTSSARWCEMCSKLWLFTSRICKHQAIVVTVKQNIQNNTEYFNENVFPIFQEVVHTLIFCSIAMAAHRITKFYTVWLLLCDFLRVLLVDVLFWSLAKANLKRIRLNLRLHT